MPNIVETFNINRSTYYYQTIQKASAHYQPVRERVSLLKQASSTTTVNQKWTTDITYIYTIQNGWTYLSSI